MQTEIYKKTDVAIASGLANWDVAGYSEWPKTAPTVAAKTR